jgi:hypothetical protein
MLKNIISIAIVAALLVIAPNAIGEKATEIYIPIGKSPGLSGKYTVIGTIEDVNYQNRTLSMSHDANRYTVTITDRTMIYLDKSQVLQSNFYGTMADCKKGMTAEVKFEDNMRSKPAEWIKLRIGQ